MKTKKKRARKLSKTKVILSAIVVVFLVLIVASYLSQQPASQPGPEKKPANEYFQVLGSTIDDGDFPKYPDTTVLLILGLSFNFTAVGGDAHEVILESVGLTDPQYLGVLTQGEIRFISLQFPQGYMSFQKEGGFPVSIRIRSTEAVGEITFSVPYE